MSQKLLPATAAGMTEPKTVLMITPTSAHAIPARLYKSKMVDLPNEDLSIYHLGR